MTYIVDATDVSSPLDTDPAPSVAAELRAIKALLATTAALTPVGVILPYAGNSAPTNYLLLPSTGVQINVSRTTYATLFAVLGTAYGAGDGTTTFGLPLILQDGSLLQQGAGAPGTTTTGSVISHNHPVTPANNAVVNMSGSGTFWFNYQTPYGFAPLTIGTTGGTNNLAAGLRVNFIIKYR